MEPRRRSASRRKSCSLIASSVIAAELGPSATVDGTEFGREAGEVPLVNANGTDRRIRETMIQALANIANIATIQSVAFVGCGLRIFPVMGVPAAVAGISIL